MTQVCSILNTRRVPKRGCYTGIGPINHWLYIKLFSIVPAWHNHIHVFHNTLGILLPEVL